MCTPAESASSAGAGAWQRSSLAWIWPFLVVGYKFAVHMAMANAYRLFRRNKV